MGTVVSTPHDAKKSQSKVLGMRKPKAGAFKPTQQWLNDFRRRLPLEPSLRLLDFFLPKIAALTQKEVLFDDTKVMELISSTTLVGVLPVPHSIIVRRYIPNAYTNQWFTTYIYGIIFLKNQKQYPQNIVKLQKF